MSILIPSMISSICSVLLLLCFTIWRLRKSPRTPATFLIPTRGIPYSVPLAPRYKAALSPAAPVQTGDLLLFKSEYVSAVYVTRVLERDLTFDGNWHVEFIENAAETRSRTAIAVWELLSTIEMTFALGGVAPNETKLLWTASFLFSGRNVSFSFETEVLVFFEDFGESRGELGILDKSVFGGADVVPKSLRGKIDEGLALLGLEGYLQKFAVEHLLAEPEQETLKKLFGDDATDEFSLLKKHKEYEDAFSPKGRFGIASPLRTLRGLLLTEEGNEVFLP